MNQYLKKLFFILLFMPLFSNAQSTHTVGPKETFYSIGRDYNVHPKELAAFNNLSFEKGLSIGQVIKIPNNKTITTSTPTKSDLPIIKKEEKIAPVQKAEENSDAIYHVVQKKENLFQIRMLYNRVPIDSLKKWNHLESDALSDGIKLIVGFKKTEKTETPELAPKKENKNTEKKTSTTTAKTTPQQKESPDINPPVTVNTELPRPSDSMNTMIEAPLEGGYFGKLFFSQNATKSNPTEETGMAAVFKSTSGWDDGKYYCLHNGATAGAIVKITNPKNKKFIFAKVLDVMPEMMMNKTVIIRVSKSGAAALGENDNDFEATLNY
jgi:LysM repeat protein